ncbi:MAG TPA: hypothetical protein VFJ52_07975, partial [Terriglobia bacterium]|nr:hypothetical protein [Terriglobia bacterium]
MPASYQVFALTILVLLLPAFAQIYRRVRDAGTLLWFLGLCLAVVYQIEQFPLGSWRMTDPRVHPWMVATGQTAILLSAILFLASLSPLSFRIGRVRVLYVIPFGLPLVAFSILLFGVFHGATPAGMPFLLFPALAGFSLLAGCLWAFQKQTMPRWISLALCIVLGGAGFRIYVTYGGVWALQF